MGDLRQLGPDASMEVIRRLDFDSLIAFCQTSTEANAFCHRRDIWEKLLRADFGLVIDPNDDPRRAYLFHRFIGFHVDKPYKEEQVNDQLARMKLPPIQLDHRKLYETFSHTVDQLPKQSGEIWTIETRQLWGTPFQNVVLVKRNQADLPPVRQWFNVIGGPAFYHLIAIVTKPGKIIMFPTDNSYLRDLQGLQELPPDDPPARTPRTSNIYL